MSATAATTTTAAAKATTPNQNAVSAASTTTGTGKQTLCPQPWMFCHTAPQSKERNGEL